ARAVSGPAGCLGKGRQAFRAGRLCRLPAGLRRAESAGRRIFRFGDGHGGPGGASKEPAGVAAGSSRCDEPRGGHFEALAMKLVILDRDGTINHDSDSHIKSPEEWRPIDGSVEAIARLTQ